MQKIHVHTRIHTDARHRQQEKEGIDKRDDTHFDHLCTREPGRFCFIKLTDRTRDGDERMDDVEGGLC